MRNTKNQSNEKPKTIITTTTAFSKLITHKLQINILSVIAISARKRIGTQRAHSRDMRSRLFEQPTRLMLLLGALFLLFLLLLLLVGNKFQHSVNGVGCAGRTVPRNCNKLNENPDGARNGRVVDRRRHHITNDMHTTAPSGSGSSNNNAGSDSSSESVAATQSRSVAADATLADRGCNTSAASRTKRFITYSGGGVVKLVVGISFPVMLADKVRSLSYFYNIQMQYTPPPRPIYWWSIYNSSTFATRRQLHAKPMHRRSWPTPLVPRRDFGREFVYAAIERIFQRQKLPGEVCLLRVICEVTRLPFYTGAASTAQSLQGLLHALLNTIFTPRLPNVPKKYLDAELAGRSGADCKQTYKVCSTQAIKWLDRLSHLA